MKCALLATCPIVALLCSAGLVSAQTSNENTAPDPAPAEQAGQNSPSPSKTNKLDEVDRSLEITIESSRVPAVIGTDFQIRVEMKNISGHSVYVPKTNCMLSIPPEGRADVNVIGSQVTFPFSDVDLIAIRPGEVFRAFWNSDSPEDSNSSNVGTTNSPTTTNTTATSGSATNSPSTVRHTAKKLWSHVAWETGFLFFSPGDYRVTYQTKYWTDPSCPPEEYRLASQTTLMHLTAPQTVILLGAALGGLISFVLFRRVVSPDASRTASRGFRPWILSKITFVRNCCFAMLWSAIVTVLLSRISESQFIVRISVTDFWGAIAIGFVANYTGAAALKKWLGGDENSSATGASGTASQAGAPGANDIPGNGKVAAQNTKTSGTGASSTPSPSVAAAENPEQQADQPRKQALAGTRSETGI